MQNRRGVNRWQIHWPAEIKFEGAESFTKCIINDITLKGLRVTLYRRLPVDAFITFNLSCSKECVLDNVQAWLVWHKHNVYDDSYTYGLYFTKIHDGDKEKIYQFVRCCFPGLMNAQWWQTQADQIREEKTLEFLAQQSDNQEGGEAMDDQRIFERFKVDFPVRYFNSGENKEVLARTMDISAKGLGIITNERLNPHAPLELWLDIPDQGEPLYTRGEVVWSKPEGPSGYRAGVNLDKADLMGLSRVLRTI